MIRYNAAHPGAEREIFPHLGDCYRFCLSSPYVDVVLTGPPYEFSTPGRLMEDFWRKVDSKRG